MDRSDLDARVASARAIAEALVGIPIVVTQQVIQNVGDLKVGGDTTVAQRVGQLRALGEMMVRLGAREAAKRLGGRRP